MKLALTPLLSRLMTICTMLCMAAMLHAGFAAVQSNVLNLQHAVSGDVLATDGGWVKVDDCDGSLASPGSHDSGPIHHHHPSSETQFGAAVDNLTMQASPFASALDFNLGEASRLADQYVSTPDQPPRV